MITKKQIISILLDYGLSPIESERVLDNEENFRLSIEMMLDNFKHELVGNK